MASMFGRRSGSGTVPQLRTGLVPPALPSPVSGPMPVPRQPAPATLGAQPVVGGNMAPVPPAPMPIDPSRGVMSRTPPQQPTGGGMVGGNMGRPRDGAAGGNPVRPMPIDPTQGGGIPRSPILSPPPAAGPDYSGAHWAGAGKAAADRAAATAPPAAPPNPVASPPNPVMPSPPGLQGGAPGVGRTAQQQADATMQSRRAGQ